MLVCTSGLSECRCSSTRSSAVDDNIRPAVSAAGRNALALLEVADILTEKPTLSETDIIALDVVLKSAREHVLEILWWSEQLPNMEREAEPPRQ